MKVKIILAFQVLTVCLVGQWLTSIRPIVWNFELSCKRYRFAPKMTLIVGHDFRFKSRSKTLTTQYRSQSVLKYYIRRLNKLSQGQGEWLRSNFGASLSYRWIESQYVICYREGGGGILYMCDSTTTCDFIVRMVITVISYSSDFGPNHQSLEKLWKCMVKSRLLCRASTKKWNWRVCWIIENLELEIVRRWRRVCE